MSKQLAEALRATQHSLRALMREDNSRFKADILALKQGDAALAAYDSQPAAQGDRVSKASVGPYSEPGKTFRDQVLDAHANAAPAQGALTDAEIDRVSEQLGCNHRTVARAIEAEVLHRERERARGLVEALSNLVALMPDPDLDSDSVQANFVADAINALATYRSQS